MSKRQILVVVLAALCSCEAPQAYEDKRHEMGGNSLADSVWRLHDRKHRVSCWLTTGSGPMGISCLPDSQVVDTEPCK